MRGFPIALAAFSKTWLGGGSVKSASSKTIVVGLILAVSFLRIATAQGESEPGDKQGEIDPKITTRVTLGDTAGTPGTSVVVPIYFTPAQNTEVGKLRVEVNYVAANVKFEKLDSGIVTETGNVDLRTEVKDGKNDKGVATQTVVITTSLSQPEAQKTGIPAGLLAYLALDVSETARPATITLRATAEGNVLGTNQPLANIRTFDAHLVVQVPGTLPTVSCFFFSH